MQAEQIQSVLPKQAQAIPIAYSRPAQTPRDAQYRWLEISKYWMLARLLFVAFLLYFPLASADGIVINKPVICVELKDILKSLRETHEEKPVFLGQDTETNYSLFVNSKTGTWTIIQFIDDFACVIGIGDSAKLVLGEKI